MLNKESRMSLLNTFYYSIQHYFYSYELFKYNSSFQNSFLSCHTFENANANAKIIYQYKPTHNLCIQIPFIFAYLFWFKNKILITNKKFRLCFLKHVF